MKDLIVFGAGGHAKVVIDIVEKQGSYRIIGILDDDERLWQKLVFGYQVLGGRDHRVSSDCEIIVALGSNQARLEVAREYRSRGVPLASAVHPSVQLGRGAVLGSGTVMMALSAVNSDSLIGDDVIINTAATVDHDCTVGDGVHIAPGAHLCGGVVVEKGALIGAGSTVLPNMKIGQYAVVGGGACVASHVPAKATVVGVPARPFDK